MSDQEYRLVKLDGDHLKVIRQVTQEDDWILEKLNVRYLDAELWISMTYCLNHLRVNWAGFRKASLEHGSSFWDRIKGRLRSGSEAPYRDLDHALERNARALEEARQAWRNRNERHTDTDSELAD